VNPVDSYRSFRSRVHDRVCIPARSCTCPDGYSPEVLDAARDSARHIHAKFEHPGPVTACQSPHDVICKAVWSE